MLRTAFLALLLAPLATGQSHPEPSVHYTLEFRPGEAQAPFVLRPEWRLRIRGEHMLQDQGAVALVFEHWGDWKEVDALYVDTLECTPAVEAALHPGNALVLLRPDPWDGSFEVELRMLPLAAGTRAQQRWGRLPSWSASYSIGESRNVFPRVYQDQGEIGGTRSVELTAPEQVGIASGWAGQHSAGQVLALDPTRDNAFLAFGIPVDQRSVDLPNGRLEVLQYGQSEPIAGPLVELLSVVAKHVEGVLGLAAPDPCVLFVPDIGSGGMAADYGVAMGYRPDLPPGYVNSPYYKHLAAHEFYHQWLGIRIKGNESIAWFHEGFTEYLSLWHLVATGQVERAWFAERLEELGQEALERSTWGQLAFGDPDSHWRDGDGPKETQAYKGGAMLAFAMDVELRNQAKAGLPQLMRDLLGSSEPRADLEVLEHWARTNGLADFWDRYVIGTQRFDVPALLAELGFARDAAGGGWTVPEADTFFLFKAPR